MLDPRLSVRLPQGDGADLSQDAEWCEVELDGRVRRIRFHDYADVYAVPGLYEHLFHDLLDCRSPEVVVGLLAERLAAEGGDPGAQRVLDLGAGNGMVGDALAGAGFRHLVGVDIVPEAGVAVARDRPGLYDAYHVCDLLDPPGDVLRSLRSNAFDALASVAALGFGDVPPEVFRAALDLVRDGGWVAFTVKDEFLAHGEPSGFAELIGELEASGELELSARRRYCHRLSVTGEPLHYVAMVGRRRTGHA